MTRSSAMVVLALALAVPAAAEPAPQDMATRTELHIVSTLTLSDAQFLAGDANAKPTLVSGELRIAQGSGKLPVVLLQHGSGGIGANVEMWVRDLNAVGISTFALDGFTGRGLTQVSTDQSQLGRLNFILDIYRALEVLAKLPRVDPQRVILMGFSRGGQAALYAALRRFQATWNRSGLDLAAYVAFYPDCATTFISDDDVSDKPIRIFGGTPDDYNPIARCKPYVERLKAAGHDVQLTEYPNAPHGFDNPFGAQPAVLSPQSQSVRNCTIREEAGGMLVNAVTRQPFTYKDPCVELGPHLGHDPDATRAARQAVKELVQGIAKRE